MLPGVQSQSQFLPEAAAAGITYVGGNSYQSPGSEGSVNLSLPAGLEEGDIVFCLYMAQGVSATISDWTVINSRASSDHFRNLAYKVMGATPDANVAVTLDSNSYFGCMVVAFRGIDPAAPFDVAGQTNRDIGRDQTYGITTTVDNAMAVTFLSENYYGRFNWEYGGDFTVALESGMRDYPDCGGTSNGSMTCAYKNIPSAGVVPAVTADSVDCSSNWWQIYTELALKPA